MNRIKRLLDITSTALPERVIRHGLFWLLYFAVTWHMSLISFNALKHTPAAYLTPLRVTVLIMLVFYFFAYVLMPRYFLRRKYLKGIFFFLLLALTYTISDTLWERSEISHCIPCMEIMRRYSKDYLSYLERPVFHVVLTRVLSLGGLYQLVIYLAPAMIIKLWCDFYRQRLSVLRLARENTQLELDFLRAQVNPHFLFNTLNNVYGLILKNRNQESAETVSRLASFMRYTLYGSDNHATLDKEVGLLNDYIALERLRLNNTLVNFQYEIDDRHLSIPPLLFIPLMENAFKFCVEETGRESWVIILLKVSGRQLTFKVSNTFRPEVTGPPGGIGLQNVRRRLEHHYAGTHSMDVSAGDDIFTVTIHINLNGHDPLPDRR